MLVANAIELLDERGVSGFSLREVARRADVAAAAPSHHFGNVAGLLTTIATAGFELLASDFENVLSQDTPPIEQVIGLCEAYVYHGRRHPGMAAIMFRDELLNQENPALCEARLRSLQLLERAVRSAMSKDASNEQISDEQISRVAKVVWATMHGLVALRMEEGEALRIQVGFAARAVLAGSDVIGFPK
ncbi:MAG: TetR/AcrR family transcriptional regulator [Bacteroidota bacterium]